MQNMANELSIPHETKIVALLARGDTPPQIQEALKEERYVSLNTIGMVKKRNKDNLAIISQKMLEKAADDALSIKNKANKIISQKLSKADNADEVLDKARDDWMHERITWKDYKEILQRFKSVSLGELVTVSKEMHTQSGADDKPPASQSDIAELAEAIRNGDEVSLTKLVFKNKPA